MKNLCISRKGKLIYELIKICNKLILSSYLLIMDTEKAFDSLDHSFLLRDLGKWIWGGSWIQNIAWTYF